MTMTDLLSMKQIIIFTIMFASQLTFADVSDFLPQNIKVDAKGNILNTDQLSKDGYAFDKNKKTISKGNVTYKFSEDENGNLVLSQTNHIDSDTGRVGYGGALNLSNQNYQHFIFDSSQKVKALVDCDSSSRTRVQPLPLSVLRTQQANCRIVTSDSCKIQSDLLKKYLGDDSSAALKKIAECKDTLKQIDNINRQTANALNLSDDSVDRLNSNLLNTFSGTSSLGKFAGSKFKNLSRYESNLGSSLQDVIRSVDQLTQSFELCNQVKDKLAPSSAKANLALSATTFQRPTPNELGKCPAPYSAENGKCEAPLCPPGQILDESNGSVNCINPDRPPSSNSETKNKANTTN